MVITEIEKSQVLFSASRVFLLSIHIYGSFSFTVR